MPDRAEIVARPEAGVGDAQDLAPALLDSRLSIGAGPPAMRGVANQYGMARAERLGRESAYTQLHAVDLELDEDGIGVIGPKSPRTDSP